MSLPLDCDPSALLYKVEPDIGEYFILSVLTDCNPGVLIIQVFVREFSWTIGLQKAKFNSTIILI